MIFFRKKGVELNSAQLHDRICELSSCISELVGRVQSLEERGRTLSYDDYLDDKYKKYLTRLYYKSRFEILTDDEIRDFPNIRKRE